MQMNECKQINNILVFIFLPCLHDFTSKTEKYENDRENDMIEITRK